MGIHITVNVLIYVNGSSRPEIAGDRISCLHICLRANIWKVIFGNAPLFLNFDGAPYDYAKCAHFAGQDVCVHARLCGS